MSFFNDAATTDIYALSLHDALPICHCIGVRTELRSGSERSSPMPISSPYQITGVPGSANIRLKASLMRATSRSEEHTSELQSRQYLVCRLLLEIQNYNLTTQIASPA